MKKFRLLSLFISLLFVNQVFAQGKNPIIEQIVKEANENSQLEKMAHELFDEIGPRLVGTPQMQQAHAWAIAKYKSWGIEARNERWGEWQGWERGIIDGRDAACMEPAHAKRRYYRRVNHHSRSRRFQCFQSLAAEGAR